MQLAIRRLSSLCMLLVISCFLGAGAYAGQPDWRVVKATGAVDIKDANQKALSTKTGSHLDAPFGVLTGTTGHTLVTHGKDELTIGTGSQVFFAQPEFTDTTIITRIKQMLGPVSYKVQHRVNDTFEVDTPNLVSVVKGATFNIHVTPDNTTVVLIKGRVWVHTPDKKYKLTLEPGQKAMVSSHSNGIILKNQDAPASPSKLPLHRRP